MRLHNRSNRTAVFQRSKRNGWKFPITNYITLQSSEYVHRSMCMGITVEYLVSLVIEMEVIVLFRIKAKTKIFACM